MKIIRFIFALSLFLYIMMGAEAWFMWPFETGVANKVLQVIIIVMAIIYKTKAKIRLTSNPLVLVAFMLFFLGVMFTRPKGFAFLVGLFCRLYPLWVVISEKDISYYLNFFQKALVAILMPGLMIHVVLLAMPDLPGIPFLRGESLFYNYVFAIKSLNQSNNYVRFCSVFLEPSYLGTLLAFFLYIDKFNFKKKINVIILISLLASLSLAGIILALVGYMLCRMSNKKSVAFIIPLSLLIGVVYFAAAQYNDGDNIVYERIFGRLAKDEDKGFSGNNRFTKVTDEYYDRLLLSGDLLLGIGPDAVEKINGGDETYDNNIAGAGYKVYFITYGLLSALFFLLFYICLSKLGWNRIYRNGFIIIIVLTFIQAAYPQSFSWIIPFIIGTKADRMYFYNKRMTLETKLI